MRLFYYFGENRFLTKAASCSPHQTVCMFVDSNGDGDDDDNVWTTTPTTFGARQSLADCAAHARSPCHTHVVLLCATHTHTNIYTHLHVLYTLACLLNRPSTDSRTCFISYPKRTAAVASLRSEHMRACRHIWVCVLRWVLEKFSTLLSGRARTPCRCWWFWGGVGRDGRTL